MNNEHVVLSLIVIGQGVLKTIIQKLCHQICTLNSPRESVVLYSSIPTNDLCQFQLVEIDTLLLEKKNQGIFPTLHSTLLGKRHDPSFEESIQSWSLNKMTLIWTKFSHLYQNKIYDKVSWYGPIGAVLLINKSRKDIETGLVKTRAPIVWCKFVTYNRSLHEWESAELNDSKSWKGELIFHSSKSTKSKSTKC